MSLAFRPPAADRRLLGESRAAGPMPWVLAIMTFITVLAAAGALALNGAARALGAQVEGRVTVQIPDADRPSRDAQAAAVTAALRPMPGIRKVHRLSERELAALIEPWIGTNDLRLPQPALIDVDLAEPAALPDLRDAVARLAPSARIDAHARTLAPVKKVIDALQSLAVTLILLSGVATAASVVLAARAALNTHRETIDVLHLLGATDLQIARLFQHRIARDALIGGALGFVAGVAVLVLLGRQAAGLAVGLTEGAILGQASWLALVLAPIAAALLATAAARLTVERALRRIL